MDQTVHSSRRIAARAPARAQKRRLIAQVLCACAIAAASAAAAAPLGTPDAPYIEFSEPFETSGTAVAGSVLVVDPAGSEAVACALPSARLRTAQRLAFATNYAAAALMRHHQEQAGGRFYLTRQDDRPASASLDDLDARLAVIRQAQPHCVVTITHGAQGAGGQSAIIVPGTNAATSDTVAVHVAECVAQQLALRGIGHFKVQVGNVPAASTGAPAIELHLPPPPPGRDWRPNPAWTHPLAQALYEGWEAAWRGPAGDALRARRTQVFHAPPFDPPEPVPPLAPGVTTETARLAQRLWPFHEPPRSTTEAQFLLSAYRRQLTDETIFYLDTHVERDGTTWRLSARTNARELGQTAAGLLRTVGCQPLDLEMTLLPDTAHLGEQLFGITLATAALTWGAPQEGPNVQTQLLPAEPVWLLDRSQDGQFYLVQGSDGYLGWVRADAIAPITAAQFDEILTSRQATLAAPWADDRLALSPGTRLLLATPAAAASRSDAAVRLRFPTVQSGHLRFENLRIARDLLTLPEGARRGQIAVETALSLYGTPYVFGGRSANGLDCSGLVGAAYEAAGLRLPRDASQQVRVGRLVATRWHRAALLPGDMLFFLEDTGRVYHTGLSLGGERFIHSCPPCVRVNSFAPGDPIYTRLWSEAFVFARRPLD